MMGRPRTIRMGVLLAALVLALPAMAFAQVRVKLVADGDRTFDLPWRDLQKGLISIDSVTAACRSTPVGAAGPAGPADATDAEPKFIGGQDSPNCIFNDLVRIDFLNTLGARARCTGVMIADHLVLTAAHCACGKVSTYKLRKHRDRKPDEVDEDATPHHLLAKPPSLFDGYFCELSPELQPGRDLAVLTLESPRDRQLRANGFSLESDPTDPQYAGLNVATTGQLFADRQESRKLIGAGYGEIDDGSMPGRPQYAAIPIASLFCAQGRFAGSICSAHREFVLADSLDRRSGRLSDSCGGDSGAPIMYMPRDIPANPENPDANASQAIMLVGITSRGLRGVSHQTNSRCGGGGIYTAIGHPDVVAWLRSFGIDIFSLLSNAQGDTP